MRAIIRYFVQKVLCLLQADVGGGELSAHFFKTKQNKKKREKKISDLSSVHFLSSELKMASIGMQ